MKPVVQRSSLLSHNIRQRRPGLPPAGQYAQYEMGRPATNYLGRQFGRLQVIDRDGSDTHGRALWRVRCACGRVRAVPSERLRRGQRSCGSCERPHRGPDLTGGVFGRWTVLARGGTRKAPTGRKRSLWLARCACGVMRTMSVFQLGWAWSCGCVLHPLRAERARVQGERDARRRRVTGEAGGIHPRHLIPEAERVRWETILASERMPEELPWGRAVPWDPRWIDDPRTRWLERQ